MSGLYLYGIRQRRSSLPKLPGVEPGTAVQGLPAGRLEVLVSPVRVRGPADWERRCSTDLDWVRRAVLRHHAVVQRLQENATVLPLKFGTLVFRRRREAEPALRRAVAAHAPAFENLLQELAEKDEWDVILTVDEAAFSARRHRRRPGSRRLSAGQAWYRDQKDAVRLRADLERAVEAALATVAEILGPVAERLVGHDVLPGEGLGRPRRAAALACLVARDQRTRFHRALAALGRALRRQGMALEQTGPWAPYHFVDLPLLTRSGVAAEGRPRVLQRQGGA